MKYSMSLLNHILIFTHDLSINFQLLQVVYTVISCFDIFQIQKTTTKEDIE